MSSNCRQLKQCTASPPREPVSYGTKGTDGAGNSTKRTLRKTRDSVLLLKEMKRGRKYGEGQEAKGERKGRAGEKETKKEVGRGRRDKKREGRERKSEDRKGKEERKWRRHLNILKMQK